MASASITRRSLTNSSQPILVGLSQANERFSANERLASFMTDELACSLSSRKRVKSGGDFNTPDSPSHKRTKVCGMETEELWPVPRLVRAVHRLLLLLTGWMLNFELKCFDFVWFSRRREISEDVEFSLPWSIMLIVNQLFFSLLAIWHLYGAYWGLTIFLFLTSDKVGYGTGLYSP